MKKNSFKSQYYLACKNNMSVKKKFFFTSCYFNDLILQLPLCYHLHMHSEPGKRFSTSPLPF